jgi:hypothetical protein
MSAAKRAYSSTVVSPGHVIAGAAAGALLAVIIPAAPVTRLLPAASVFLAGIYVATVRITVGHKLIVLGQGPFGRPRWGIPLLDVADAQAVSLSRAQVFGIGVPWHRRTTRMTVRPGPTLVLRLTTGEYVRVSTPDPRAAVAIIRSALPPGHDETATGRVTGAEESL